MKEDRPHPQAHASASGGCDTAEGRWNIFQRQLQLIDLTKVPLSEQKKLEKIPNDDLLLILNKYQEGTNFSKIHRYVQTLYDIRIDQKALARYWREAIPDFRDIEDQQREMRTTERALRSLNQKGDKNET